MIKLEVMKTHFFKTNPWIIFLIFLVANFLAYFLSSGAQNNISTQSFIQLCLYFLWILYVYLGVSVIDREYNNNSFSLSFLLAFIISISLIIINQIISTTLPISIALYVLALMALFYCYFVIIKKIVKLEKNKKAGFTDYLDLGLSLIVYIIGWYDIQRRIRSIILRNEKNTI